MTRLSFFGWPETGLLSGGDTGPCPISRGHLRPQSFNYEPERGQQRQGATGWPEGHIERAKQGQQPRLVDQVAGDPYTEEPLVRQDVAGSLRWIAGDHQALVDTKVHHDHDREGEQVEESRDSCSLAWRLGDGAGRHSVPPRTGHSCVGEYTLS